LSIASIITVAFMGSVIVTPLYPLYQRKFGFSEITLTLIYAVYVVGNVAALLAFGQISDQVGRKRVALPAIVLAALSAVLFMTATGTLFLFLARMLIGFAVGVASGTGTAWLAEEFGPDHRQTATLSAATANLFGVALGPLIGGLLAEYAPWPLKLSFLVYIALLVIVAVVIARVPVTRQPRVRKLSEVRVQLRIGVPRELLGAFTTPAVTGFAIFALGGLYFALIPSVVAKDLHEKNVAVSGLIVFELGILAAVLIVLGRRLRPAAAMSIGSIALLPAVVLVVIAQAARSMPVLVVATAFAAVTLGLGYRGSLQIVNEIAPDDRRAEVVSSYYISCFLGNSVPVIGLGVLTTLTKALTASIVFAATIAVLGIGALLWRGRMNSSQPHETQTS
jgi:predicted MFS family arabinose efflux permease